MDNNRALEKSVSEAVVAEPIRFSVEGRAFEIKRPTIGKLQVLAKYYLLLDIDEKKLKESPIIEAMRICEEKADDVCRLIAVASMNEEKELQDQAKINNLANFIKWNCHPEDFSTVILAIHTQTDFAGFTSSIRSAGMLRLNSPNI